MMMMHGVRSRGTAVDYCTRRRLNDNYCEV